MSVVYIDQEELRILLNRFEVPVDLECQAGQIIVTGSYRLLGEKEFQAVLRFQKIRGTSIVFKIIRTQPSFGVLDAFIKRTVFHWLEKSGYMAANEMEALGIDYPFITVEGRKLPAVQRALEYLTIDGIDFESEGIRLRFRLRPAIEQESVEHERA